MANELKMDQREAIRNLAKHGWSQRRIARELSVHRSAVKRALADGGDSKRTISLTGKTAGRSSKCAEHRPVIEAYLEAGLDARRIHDELLQEGFSGSYASVQRFVKGLKQVRPKRVWRMEVEPGEEAQIDYGTMRLIKGEDGRPKRVHLLRVTLSFSRKSYSEAMLRQDAESFLRGLENAFRYFGGVPQRLCVDNLKAAVLKADWYDPQINPKLLSFADHYGTVIMPTRPYRPEHKGKIERNIQSLKRHLKGRLFDALASLNAHLRTWESQVADQRIHGTTRRQVAEHFLSEEKAALRPLPPDLFPCFQEGRRKVGRDCYVVVAGAYYQVPEQYIGRSVWARWDARMVRILDTSQQLICSHVRLAEGQFTHVLGSDGRRGSFEQYAGYYRQRCARIGEAAAAWADGVIANRGPMAGRIMQGLLRLLDKHGKGRIEEACRQAHEHGHYHLKELKAHLDAAPPQESFEFMQTHEIIRQPQSYDRHIATEDLFDAQPSVVTTNPSTQAI